VFLPDTKVTALRNTGADYESGPSS